MFAVFGAWTPCLVDKSASRAQRVLELPGEDQTLGELILAAKPSGMTGLMQKGMPGTAD